MSNDCVGRWNRDGKYCSNIFSKFLDYSFHLVVRSYFLLFVEEEIYFGLIPLFIFSESMPVINSDYLNNEMHTIDCTLVINIKSIALKRWMAKTSKEISQENNSQMQWTRSGRRYK